MRAAPTMIAAAAFGAPLVALADQAPDLAKYDCARADGGETVAADALISEGFRIASVGRFGQQPNVMLVEPKSNARANCFVRRESN